MRIGHRPFVPTANELIECGSMASLSPLNFFIGVHDVHASTRLGSLAVTRLPSWEQSSFPRSQSKS